jgi:SpoU rRNA methylase family enzyme
LFIKFPIAEADVELSRFATTSWRKVVRFGLLADALVVLLDELLPESAEIRLLKSDCSVLRVLFVEEVEDAVELFEPAFNCEISCSSPLEKLE